MDTLLEEYGESFRLDVPAPLLREGENTIVVFDVLANEKEKSVFLGEG